MSVQNCKMQVSVRRRLRKHSQFWIEALKPSSFVRDIVISGYRLLSMFLPGHTGHNFGDSLNADSVLLALCLDFSIMPRVSNVGACTIGGCSNCLLT